MPALWYVSIISDQMTLGFLISQIPTVSVMVLRLAVLLCDTPNPTIQAQYGDYLAIFKQFFQSSLPNKKLKYTVDGFDVVNKQEYPSLDANYDCILLTGSGE